MLMILTWCCYAQNLLTRFLLYPAHHAQTLDRQAAPKDELEVRSFLSLQAVLHQEATPRQEDSQAAAGQGKVQQEAAGAL